MNLTSPAYVKDLADKLGIRPNKCLGQNFLIDGNILRIMLEAADVRESDAVLEIGGGLGVLTEKLAEQAGKLVVIEKDRRLAGHLQEVFGGWENTEIICADAVDIIAEHRMPNAESQRKIQFSDINKVVANMPYSVGTKLMVDMIRAREKPEMMVVTVQIEVAERFIAGHGSRDYGVLSVWSHLYYDVNLVKTVNRTCFWPRPEVESGILRLEAKNGPGLSMQEEETLYSLTKYAFGHRRKQVISILNGASGRLHMERDQAGSMLESLGIGLKARPSDLALEDWVGMAGKMAENS